MADAVLIVHVAVAAFLAGGQLAILAGGLSNVGWVRNPWFRVVHLGLITFIAGQSMLGRVCPLTQLEQYLRQVAWQPPSQPTITQAWLSHLLFFDAPSWVFTMADCVAAVVILVTWFAVPPTWRSKMRPAIRSVALPQAGSVATGDNVSNS